MSVDCLSKTKKANTLQFQYSRNYGNKETVVAISYRFMESKVNKMNLG